MTSTTLIKFGKPVECHKFLVFGLLNLAGFGFRIPIVALFLIVGTIAGVLSIRRYRFQVVRRPVHVPAVVVTTTTQQQTSAQPVPLSEKAPAGYPVTGHPIPYPDPATK
jgi:hypothetical protein